MISADFNSCTNPRARTGRFLHRPLHQESQCDQRLCRRIKKVSAYRGPHAHRSRNDT